MRGVIGWSNRLQRSLSAKAEQVGLSPSRVTGWQVEAEAEKDEETGKVTRDILASSGTTLPHLGRDIHPSWFPTLPLQPQMVTEDVHNVRGESAGCLRSRNNRLLTRQRTRLPN